MGDVPEAPALLTSFLAALAVNLLICGLVWIQYTPVIASLMLFKGIAIVVTFYVLDKEKMNSLEHSAGIK